MRQWISVRGPGGLRFGQSIGLEDFGPPKLPSWRRYELRKRLQAAAPSIVCLIHSAALPRAHRSGRRTRAARRTRHWFESLSRCRDVSYQMKLLEP